MITAYELKDYFDFNFLFAEIQQKKYKNRIIGYRDNSMEQSSNNPYLLADLTDEQEEENQENQESDASMYESFYCHKEDPPSPKLINLNMSVNKTIIDEITSFFKLDNLFTCIQKDEGKEYKKNISISKIIMDNIIDKRLGSVTYHYGNKKSAKAYHTYDYPEIYYGKKMYNNITQWLKEEFYKKI
jgi:hypothetical protein